MSNVDVFDRGGLGYWISRYPILTYHDVLDNVEFITKSLQKPVAYLSLSTCLGVLSYSYIAGFSMAGTIMVLGGLISFVTAVATTSLAISIVFGVIGGMYYTADHLVNFVSAGVPLLAKEGSDSRWSYLRGLFFAETDRCQVHGENSLLVEDGQQKSEESKACAISLDAQLAMIKLEYSVAVTGYNPFKGLANTFLSQKPEFFKQDDQLRVVLSFNPKIVGISRGCYRDGKISRCIKDMNDTSYGGMHNLAWVDLLKGAADKAASEGKATVEMDISISCKPQKSEQIQR